MASRGGTCGTPHPGLGGERAGRLGHMHIHTRTRMHICIQHVHTYILFAHMHMVNAQSCTLFAYAYTRAYIHPRGCTTPNPLAVHLPLARWAHSIRSAASPTRPRGAWRPLDCTQTLARGKAHCTLTLTLTLDLAKGDPLYPNPDPDTYPNSNQVRPMVYS
jgi:hypothetical protein